MNIARLGPTLRERDRDQRPVGRGLVPVDRRPPARVDLVGIDQRPRRFGVIRGLHHDQKRLLPRRLPLDRKDLPFRDMNIRIAHRLRRINPRHPIADFLDMGKGVEDSARVGVLRFTPRPHRRILPVLKPLIGINNGHAVVGVGHGPLLRGDLRPSAGAREGYGGQRCDAGLHRHSPVVRHAHIGRP